MIKKMKDKNIWGVKLLEMAVDTENGKIKKKENILTLMVDAATELKN